MKSIKISTEVWRELKLLALDKETSITKVIEELLNDKSRENKTIQQDTPRTD